VPTASHSRASSFDSAGAYPGIGAEEGAVQAEAIARRPRLHVAGRAHVAISINGDGMSGGAIAITTPTNRVLMFEHAISA